MSGTNRLYVKQEQNTVPTHVLMPKGVVWMALGTFVLGLLLGSGILAFCGIILYQQKANYTSAWVREADYQKEQKATNAELRDDLGRALDAVRILRSEMIAAGVLPSPGEITAPWPRTKQEEPPRDAAGGNSHQ